MDELVFSVDGNKATPATPVSLAEAGLRERADLQEWVLAHPEILGVGVMPISFEFDQWRNAAGDRERDRLDVLGLAADGRLVVVELKRDRAPDTVEMQAIKYAAMSSRFTPEMLAASYARFESSRGELMSEEDALARLEDHVGTLDPELMRQPRIVLVAGSFPPVVTASVVWLTEMGVDISLRTVQAYRIQVDDAPGIIISVSVLYPLPDVEDFTVTPVSQRARAAARRGGRAGGPAIRRLINSGVLPDGSEVSLSIPGRALTPDSRAAVEAWLADNPARGKATWRNERPPLVWALDGQPHRPSELVRHILQEAAGVTVHVQGGRWWATPDGVDLITLSAGLGGGFDWQALHDLLAALPAGKWTTYGDLGRVIGTAAQPIGNHITRCPECTHAWRVLNANGRIAPNFSWSDPSDTREPQQLLEREGVRFVNDVADDTQRLSLDELRALVEE